MKRDSLKKYVLLLPVFLFCFQMSGGWCYGNGVGVQDHPQTPLLLYPNPYYGDLTLEATCIPGTLQIINTLGQVIMNRDITEPRTRLSIQTNSGVYSLQYKSVNEQIRFAKLLLQ